MSCTHLDTTKKSSVGLTIPVHPTQQKGPLPNVDKTNGLEVATYVNFAPHLSHAKFVVVNKTLHSKTGQQLGLMGAAGITW